MQMFLSQQALMFGPVTTCVGSTRGSQPLPDPTRLPSHWESPEPLVPRHPPINEDDDENEDAADLGD
ncbi:hypothetical protein TIFTF001_019993 [Ficus carica]|uniref:Uncharacterized protein n=1 Tax=Ficus carica TaxID=3494 RepID=A0AA88AFA1_FICCA|nr:hypothetical protein TIFTF001_019993 [Ficus carica]